MNFVNHQTGIFVIYENGNRGSWQIHTRRLVSLRKIYLFFYIGFFSKNSAFRNKFSVLEDYCTLFLQSFHERIFSEYISTSNNFGVKFIGKITIKRFHIFELFLNMRWGFKPLHVKQFRPRWLVHRSLVRKVQSSMRRVLARKICLSGGSVHWRERFIF